MDCHYQFWTEILHDKDLYGHKQPIPFIIQRDEHSAWDKSYYDFGHYGGPSIEGHCNYHARYIKKRLFCERGKFANSS